MLCPDYFFYVLVFLLLENPVAKSPILGNMSQLVKCYNNLMIMIETHSKSDVRIEAEDTFSSCH